MDQTINIKQIQELMRTLDATLAAVNPSGLSNGQNAMQIINFISQFPNMKPYVGTEFIELINNESINSQKKDNVREHVKKVWTYPNYAYNPWTELYVWPIKLSKIHQKLSGIKFQFRVIDGKVYLCPISGSLSKLIYDNVKELIYDEVIPNTEASHVTVINSNIVYDIGIDKVIDFVDKYQAECELTYGKFKSTVSDDWSVFSKCYVIEISSGYLTNFIADFNKVFHRSVKPSPHVTFAIKPRKLFN